MRIDIVNGRKLLCGEIRPISRIKVGQTWAPSDGKDRVITVTGIKGHVVYYHDPLYGDFHKDYFGFQCRYCQIVD